MNYIKYYMGYLLYWGYSYYYYLFLYTNTNFENNNILQTINNFQIVDETELDIPPTYEEILEQDKKTLPTYEEITKNYEEAIDVFEYFKYEINSNDLQNQTATTQHKLNV